MKRSSNLGMYVFFIAALVFFIISVKSAFDLPTVYRSTLTQECVRATDSHGKKIFCEQAEKGKYHLIWI